MFLHERKPELKKSDFDTGVSSVDFTSQPRRTLPPRPDGKVPAEEIRQLALTVAENEYIKFANDVRDGGCEGQCIDIKNTIFYGLNQRGMYVPWFHYDVEKLRDAIFMVEDLRSDWEKTGDLRAVGAALYDRMISPAGFGMKYYYGTEYREVGMDDLVQRKIVRCEEMYFMLKGLALIIGIQGPTGYDTARNDSYDDHVFSSFELKDGTKLFLDPLHEPFVADAVGYYEDPVEVSGLYALGIYEMNAVTRNCDFKNTDCQMGHARRSISYSPIYRNSISMGNRFALTGDFAQARKEYRRACKQNPFFVKCREK